MSAVKKIYDDAIINSQNENEEIPLWKRKKMDRQKLLRAIRAKFFTETVRNLIRTELKKDDSGENKEG